MPPLPDPRQEAFAQARAQGKSGAAAYREAGYRPNRGGASALARRPAMAKRIETLKGQGEKVARAGLAETIAELVQCADECAKLGSAAAFKEARTARLEANRLAQELKMALARTASLPPPMSRAEWLECFAPKSGS